ncbi:hypothetical protein EUGRSUZ_A02840 [Eucalyptus grandis]|uniref:Uncharacterized protein n=2 Tax=Eucalyptus grandis TaxID=71139 RepID=A0ACC3M7S5_EUCGR|nr:hypothetical protein EUGRSUZ_A02840 [Eucalyptus grandis]
MTRPGKTSSGSWICGFRSTMNGSPHLSLIVWSVSPSRTTYISSQGQSKSRFPLTLETLASLMEATKMSAMTDMAQHHAAASAIVLTALTAVLLFPEEAMNL